MRVWIVEAGKYERGYLFGLYDSLESAVEGVKRSYPAPHKVEWLPLEESGDEYVLTGRFSFVRNLTADRDGHYYIRPMEVQSLAIPLSGVSMN